MFSLMTTAKKRPDSVGGALKSSIFDKRFLELTCTSTRSEILEVESNVDYIEEAAATQRSSEVSNLNYLVYVSLADYYDLASTLLAHTRIHRDRQSTGKCNL